VADEQRLSGQGQRWESGEEDGHVRDVPHRRELAIDGFPKHDLRDDLVLGQSQFPRLLRELALDEGRADETGANYVGTDPVRRPLNLGRVTLRCTTEAGADP
jgi:hypothetical protein